MYGTVLWNLWNTKERSMIDKSKHFLQFARFVFVGVLNTIVGYGGYLVFLYFGFHYLAAMVGSHVVGVTNSYFWNKYWTFKSRIKSHAEKVRFISVYAVTFVLNAVILTLLIQKIGMGAKLAGLVALLVVTVVSFGGHKLWSFKQ